MAFGMVVRLGKSYIGSSASKYRSLVRGLGEANLKP